MKKCIYCKSDIEDEATRCPCCTSILEGEQEPDRRAQVTYILDRDRVRFAKFSVSVIAVLLITGVLLYGFNLKEATEEIRKVQHESSDLNMKMKEIQLEILKTKEEVAKLVQDAGVWAEEIRITRDSAKQVNQETQVVLLEIRAGREQVRTHLAQPSGQPRPASSGINSQQVDRMIETKLRKSFRSILTGDQYAKLEEELKSAVPIELRRAIYDAENRMALPGKLVRSEGEPPTGDSMVTQVYDNIEIIYNFFISAFGRNINSDTGGTIVVTVHYGNAYDNTFWDGEQLVIGDSDGKLFNSYGFGSLSTMASELSHPVIQSTVRLPYNGQPGALYSHFTDVFSALAQQWHKKQKVDEANWLIGSDVLAPGIKGVALRSMKAPGTAYNDPMLGKDSQPDHIDKYVETISDNGGVHINSGIPNRAFYEVAKGIGGYAWEKTGKIWYESMLKTREDATFKDFAQICFTVAGELYGGGSPEQEAVRKGWGTVGIAVGGRQRS
jgi:hypothetical protein